MRHDRWHRDYIAAPPAPRLRGVTINAPRRERLRAAAEIHLLRQEGLRAQGGHASEEGKAEVVSSRRVRRRRSALHGRGRLRRTRFFDPLGAHSLLGHVVLVCFAVHAEATALAEALLAVVDAAEEWFFAAVCVFVLAQVLAQREGLLAEGALVLADALVDEVVVPPQRKAALEHFPAPGERAGELLLRRALDFLHVIKPCF